MNVFLFAVRSREPQSMGDPAPRKLYVCSLIGMIRTKRLRLQVLEWSGVSLIDRSFEEVQQIIERTDDVVVDLIVEHATDM